MVAIPNRRSALMLYSNKLCPYSHRIRIALAEKGVTTADILEVGHDGGKPNEDLLDLNPYGTVPTLVDRDLILYESGIIAEYLDERFPHPPLLPVYPVARARMRLLMHRIDQDWYRPLLTILNGTPEEANIARKELVNSLTSVTRLFSEMPFFLSEEFTLVDCYLAPLLWRLPSLNIDLPSHAKPIITYAKKIFSRNSFLTSLTDSERELR